MNTEILQEGLKKLKQQQFEKAYLQQYYDNDHDIKRSYRMQNAQSNKIVILPYPKKFVEERISYILANPINYVSKIGDDHSLNVIDMNFSHWEKLHNQELVRQSQIFGESYEIMYLNEDSEFRCGVLNPLNCVVFESGDIEKKVTMAIHQYQDSKDNEFIDVYDKNKITTYRVDGDNFEKIEEREHIFKGVPVTVMKGSARSHSLIEDIKSIVDNLEIIASDGINELGDHRSANLKLINTKIEKEDADKMKESGLIEVIGDKADVQWLIKDLPSDFVKMMLEILEEKLFQVVNSVNTSEALQSNLSGAAIRGRLISIEFIASAIESQLEYTIKQRLKHFFHFHYLNTGERLEYRTIKIKTTKNIPYDLSQISDSADKLKNIVAQETLLGLLPFVENPSLEKAKFDAEQASQIQSLNDIR